MWGPEEEFDFNGKYLNLRSVRSKPKPYGGSRPLIMNAGVSQTGRAYALRNCDALFTAVRYPTLEAAAKEVADMKAAGRAIGQDIGVYTVGEIVCRPTRAEAEEYFRYWTEEAADWGAVDYMLELKRVRREDDPDRYDRMRKALVHGQSGFPMIGSPDDVAQELSRISSAGFDGIGFSFVNYLNELPYFAQEVLPRLQRLGLHAATLLLEPRRHAPERVGAGGRIGAAVHAAVPSTETPGRSASAAAGSDGRNRGARSDRHGFRRGRCGRARRPPSAGTPADA